MRHALLVTTSVSIVAAIVVACGSSDGEAPSASPDGGASSSSSSGGNGDDSGTGSSSSSGGPSGIYVAAKPGDGTAYCDGTFGKIVGKLSECCSADDQTTQEWKLAAGILTLATQQCGPRFERGVAAGRLEIDAAAAQSCYAAWSQAIGSGCFAGGTYGIDPDLVSNPGLAGGLSDCRKVFRGKSPANGACAQDYDCLDGLTCVGYTQDSDGVCKQPPAIGESCGDAPSDAGVLYVPIDFKIGVHPKCATGLYCSGKKCAQQAAPGETCIKDEQCAGGKTCHAGVCGDVGDSDANGSCKVSEDCKTGLYCAGATSTELGTCQPKLSDGAACSSSIFNQECKGRCDKPDGGGAGTCKSFCGSG